MNDTNICINKINQNIKKYGLKRYDLRDLRWNSFLLSSKPINKLCRKIILSLEAVCPITIRKVFRIDKKIWPTTYSFLGNAYLNFEEMNYKNDYGFTSSYFKDLCINEFMAGDNPNEWWMDEPHIGILEATIDVGHKQPTLLMHALERCNIFLMNYALKNNDKGLINKCFKTVKYVMKHYHIEDFGNHKKGISYFYNTIDCTININSEFVYWLSMFPYQYHDKETIDMLYSGINLVLDEQNEDGSWFYFSKWHMKKYNILPKCDCHHTATVLFNLINLLNCPYLQENYYQKIISSIDKGMKFYLNNFFNKENGQAILQINLNRKAGPVQYSEAIFAFCAYLNNYKKFEEKLVEEVRCILDKIIQINMNFINRKGCAPSQIVFIPLNLNSIRWGNGPILQSISEYMKVQTKHDKKL